MIHTACRRRLRLTALPLLLGLAACGGDDAGTGPDGGAGPDAGPTACTAMFDEVTSFFADADATALGACTTAAGLRVADSVMNLAGVTIDNNGATETPCVEVRCDADFAYIASNALPHYDFVQTTPNALAATPMMTRVPLAPQPIAAPAGAADATTLTGCTAAYDAYLSNPDQGTNNEPSGFCTTGATSYVRDQLGSGDSYFAKLPCLGAEATTISGVPGYGPNEARMPDPWGNPAYFYPDVYGESYVPADPRGGAALDLCGGHTGMTMYYHAVNAACFARDDDGRPAASYVDGASTWDMVASLGDACTEESGIVAWSIDGYPIMGPCVCVARAGDGSCTDVRRARSSWTYEGLASWGNAPNEDQVLGLDGDVCADDDACCPAGVDGCDYRCTPVVATAGNGTAIEHRCTLLDYSWCTSRFTDRTAADTSGETYVYLDRCNGFEGPDGYAYHATLSFPLLQGCFHGEPTGAVVVSGGGGAP